MKEIKPRWENFSDRGVKVYPFIALIIGLILVIITILSPTVPTMGKLIISIAFIVLIPIVYILYRIWYKYYYVRFFKKKMYDYTEKANKK